jgi:hypothetical protein
MVEILVMLVRHLHTLLLVEVVVVETMVRQDLVALGVQVAVVLEI